MRVKLGAKDTFLKGGESRGAIQRRKADRQGGVERSAGGEERDGAMLLLDVFDVVAAFSPALALKLAVDFQLRVKAHTTHGGPTNRSAEKWSRYVMVSLL